MNLRTLGAGATVAVFGVVVSIAAGSRADASAAHTVTVTKTVYVRSTTSAPGIAARISKRLAGFGGSVTSPRGPWAARPSKVAFDQGGSEGTRGLWIDHLVWVDWGQPVAFATGIVHALDSSGSGYVETQGAVTVYALRGCRARSYYTDVSMVAPSGFPANSESTITGEGQQALTPC